MIAKCEEEQRDEGILTDMIEYFVGNGSQLKLYTPFDKKPMQLLKCVPLP